MDEELYNYLISEDVEEPENEDLDTFLEHANLNSVLNEAIDPTIKSKVQGAAQTVKGAASQAAQGASNAVQGAAKAVKDNVATAASAISSKAEEYLGKIGGFVTKELTNINGALEKASQKVNENPDVKLVGDIATNTIEILKVPSLVFKAGDKISNVFSGLRRYTEVITNAFHKQGNEASNKCKQILQTLKGQQPDQEKVSFAQGLLNSVNAIVQGFGSCVRELGKAFAGLWQSLKSGVSSVAQKVVPAKKEEVEIVDMKKLTEEVDELLSL